MINPETTKPTRISYSAMLAAALGLISLLRVFYILWGPLDLSPDEALYWDCTRRPELSYYTKGPLIVYLMLISTHMFGTSVFGVRILAVVFSALSSLYLYKLCVSMFDASPDSPVTPVNREGQFVGFTAAMLFQIIPLYAAYGVIFTIDSPFVYLWIASLYTFWKIISLEERGKNAGYGLWILLGILTGVGFMAKYIMAFFYICAFLFLILTKNRRLLKTPKPYISFIVGIIALSPVIIWNAAHGWVTLKHTAGHAHVADGFKLLPLSLLEFTGSQLGVVTPVVLFLIIAALFRLRGSQRGDFLFYFSIPVLLFFTLKSIQGKVQANWAMTGYITGIAAAAWVYYKKEAFRALSIHAKRTIVIGTAAALVVTIVGHFPVVLHLHPDNDPASRLRGWREFGDRITTLYGELKQEGKAYPHGTEVLLVSDKYQVTAEMAFYTQGNPLVYCINLGRRVNEYDMWPGINEYAQKIRMSAPLRRIDAVFATDGSQPLHPFVAFAFDRCEKTPLTVNENGQILREYSIFKCYNFKGMIEVKPNTY
ncbi:ArnT family glycosyltransferase [Candidatus Magnetominusculus xianensis]|uniref:Dolichyl-phosphate-mannose-protein mannosyltransferase n=1 Tax=Candidatus Magnetominusculus xianensis TaxID=1748249 RepID=A0ABR5SG45_9BACT|nr:glycosyltransferase family 39 protein [Candidatus Magnetominusculus xianensis]KWT84946.1 dolichyl-phosphate-mannose-protein mannosyltransferase [Candidatus Magnetominusculus xianensis]MBF0404472.1 glycosyltransferase family 39 protein [Nitrospirota bacterium]